MSHTWLLTQAVQYGLLVAVGMAHAGVPET